MCVTSGWLRTTQYLHNQSTSRKDPLNFYSNLKKIFFLIFWLCRLACRISVPWPGFEPGTLKWKPKILSTMPVGNSLQWIFKTISVKTILSYLGFLGEVPILQAHHNLSVPMVHWGGKKKRYIYSSHNFSIFTIMFSQSSTYLWVILAWELGKCWKGKQGVSTLTLLSTCHFL